MPGEGLADLLARSASMLARASDTGRGAAGSPGPGRDPGAGGAVPYALALHLGPRTEDTNRFNQRPWLGWDADERNRDDAWTGWWNTGERIADACVVAALPVLPSVSGVVVDVRIIRGWTPHSVYPGLVQFQVAPAPAQLRDSYAHTVFRPAPGPP